MADAAAWARDLEAYSPHALLAVDEFDLVAGLLGLYDGVPLSGGRR